jgi:hypothetical protein
MGQLWKIQNMLVGLRVEISTTEFSNKLIKNATHPTTKLINTRAEKIVKIIGSNYSHSKATYNLFNLRKYIRGDL